MSSEIHILSSEATAPWGTWRERCVCVYVLMCVWGEEGGGGDLSRKGMLFSIL